MKRIGLSGLVLSLVALLGVASPAIALDEVIVTAIVGAKPENFTISIEKISPVGTVISSGDQIVYRLNYEHNLTFGVNVTLVASWNSDSPVVSYVVGSATNAYGSSTPVIDTSAGTITWNTGLVPAGVGNQYVEFTLSGNTVVTSSNVPVEVKGQVVQPITSNIATDTFYYNYQTPVAPTPTPTPTLTPAPTTTASPIPSATPEPTPTPEIITSPISKVEIVSLSDISAKIRATLTSPRVVKIVYKSDTGETFESEASSIGDINPVFELMPLSPKTKYSYWFFDAETGEKLTRETFEFITPEAGVEIIPGPFSFHVLYKDQLVNHWEDYQENVINWLVPNLSYTLIARFDQAKTTISQSWLEIWYNDKSEPVRINLTQERLNQLQAELLLPDDLVSADVYLYYKLTNGSQLSTSLGKIGVAKPLQIIDQSSNIPLEHVQVEVLAYEASTRTYTKLELPNIFTQSRWDGIVPLTLPAGKYRFKLNLPGYIPQTLELSWPLNEANVPINMKPSGNIVMQIWGQLTGFLGGINKVLFEGFLPLFKNTQIFRAAVLLTGLLTAILVFLIVSFKTHTPLRLLPELFIVFWRKRPLGNQEKILVRDKQSCKPLPDAEVTVVDPDDHEPEQRGFTNRNGMVTVQTSHRAVEIFVSRQGYEATSSIVVFDADIETINLEAVSNDLIDVRFVARLTGMFLKVSLELILFISLLFQIIVLINFGWIGLPLFLLTLFANIFWWIYNLAGYPQIRI